MPPRPRPERNEHESSWREEDSSESLQRQEKLERFNIDDLDLPFIRNSQDLVRELGDHVSFLENTMIDFNLGNYDPGERLYTEYHEAQDDLQDPQIIDLEAILERSLNFQFQEDQQQRQETGKSFLQILRELFARFINLFRRARPTTLKAGEKSASSTTKDSTALLFAYYGRLALGEPIDDLKDFLPEDLQQSASQLYTQWREQPESDFWQTMAAYPQADPKATLMDHIYFCQFIKVIAPSRDLWMWEKGADQLTLINNLVNLYHQSPESSVAIFYDVIATYQYQDQPLPRDVAADLIELAITKILKNLPGSQMKT